jgi:hypothetical protein
MSEYEWFTDPAGNKHFYRVKPKAAKPKKAAAVVEAPVEVAAEEVVDDPLAAAETVVIESVPKRASAKKKSDG